MAHSLAVASIATAAELRAWSERLSALRSRIAHPPASTSLSWLLAMSEVYGAPPLVSLFLRGDSVVAAICLEPPSRAVRSFASALSDECPILLDPSLSPAEQDQVAEALFELGKPCGIFELRLVGEDAAILLDRLACKSGVRIAPQPVPRLELAARDTHMKTSFARRLAYFERRLSRAYHVGARVTREGPQLRLEVADLLRLRRECLVNAGRIAEMAPQTVDRRYDDFVLELAQERCGVMSVSAVVTLELDGLAACRVLLLDAGATALYYCSGWDHRFTQLSVGSVGILYAIRWAREQGFARFDFGLGAEPYKFRFGAEEHFRHDVSYRRRS